MEPKEGMMTIIDGTPDLPGRGWPLRRYGLLAGVLLPLFPAGTVLAIILFYQLIKRDW